MHIHITFMLSKMRTCSAVHFAERLSSSVKPLWSSERVTESQSAKSRHHWPAAKKLKNEQARSSPSLAPPRTCPVMLAQRHAQSRTWGELPPLPRSSSSRPQDPKQPAMNCCVVLVVVVVAVVVVAVVVVAVVNVDVEVVVVVVNVVIEVAV